MNKTDKKVQEYIRRALCLLEIKINGKEIKGMDDLADEPQKYLIPIIIEIAKMIQLEELSDKGEE